MTPPLGCPGCRRRFTAREFLDACNGAFPSHQVVLWECPDCGLRGGARLTSGSLELGDWDAVPGPRFVVQQAHEGLEWTVTWSERGPEVRLPEGDWLLAVEPSTPSWLPELRLIGEAPRGVGEAELKAAEDRLQQPLPPSYRAFMRRYGPGLAMDALRLLAPGRLRWDSEHPELLLFGEGLDGQVLGWNTRLRAGRGELWMELLLPGSPPIRRSAVAPNLGELLMLAVDADDSPSSGGDPLGLGDRYTDRIFEPAS